MAKITISKMGKIAVSKLSKIGNLVPAIKKVSVKSSRSCSKGCS